MSTSQDKGRMRDAHRALSLIDLTSLGDNDQPEMIDALCEQAHTAYGPVAAVCVWPRFVAQAVERLAGSTIAVAAVANFPHGNNDTGAAAAEATSIVNSGASEVDIVFPWRTLAAGTPDAGRRLVEATRMAVGDDTTLKVILETGELDDVDLIRAAAEEALDGGADFLKTSTGKTGRSATPEAVNLLLHLVHERGVGGVKVSGGVRTTEQAIRYLKLADDAMGAGWAAPTTYRIGASSLLADLVATLAGEAGRP